MRKLLLFLLAMTSCTSAFSQLEFNNSLMGRRMDARDINGLPLYKKGDTDAEGYPLVSQYWVLAKLTAKNGKIFGPLQVNLNLENNELYYLDSAGQTMSAVEGIIKRVDCTNFFTKDSIRYLFKSGYPAVDKQSENFFYQVLSEGKAELLVKKTKYLRTTKNELSGEIIKEYMESSPFYYVYNGQNMQEIHLNKNIVITALEDKKQEVSLYADTNKINFKKVADVVRLFEYYNRISK